MKLFRNLGKYPFVMLLSISAIILTIAAYLGRNSVYADYSADLLNYPRLTVVFEGIKDKKYPWEVLTDQNKIDSAYNSTEEVSPAKNSDSLSENPSEETAANSTQTSHSKPPVKDHSAQTAPAADGTGIADSSNDSDTSSGDSKASGAKNGDNKASDTDNGSSKGSNTKGGDNKASDSRNGDNNGSDSKASDPRNGDSNGSDSKASDPRNGDSNGSDTKGQDSKDSDTKSEDSKISNTKGGNGKDSDTKSEDSKNTGTKDGDSKGSDTKSGDSKNTGTKDVDSKDSDTKGGNKAATPFKGFTVVSEDYFDDALFIGDSRTVGLSEYSGWKKPAFYSDIGLTIYDVFDKKIAKVDGKLMTIKDALHKKSFGKIYIMLGINEMGTGNAKTFTKAYKDVVEQLKTLQPDAIIYVEAIMNVTKEKSDHDPIFNNTNIGKRNKHLATLADNKQVFYIDVNEAITDSTGGIPAKYTFDNIHLKAAYYKLWTDFLLQHGVELP